MYITKISLEGRKTLYIKARDQYYNEGNSELTDIEFDALEDSIRADDPDWKHLHSTGIKVPKKFEVELLAPMPSLDKIKSDAPEGVERWLKTVAKIHPQVHVSEKIDGSSIQGVWKRGKLVQLVTRGDGLNGKDISGLIPHVNLPKYIPLAKDKDVVVVRMEATIPIKTYMERYQGAYDSDRAMASAVLNRLDLSPAIRHIDFVALRVLNPVFGVAQGIEWLKEAGFLVPRGKVIRIDKLNAEVLASMTENIKLKSTYTLDGLVLYTSSQEVEHLKTEDRPKFGRAFKLNDLENAVETEIVDIQWNPSSFGVIVPKAIIKPIQFGNVTVKQAALHNAAWALHRQAGVGATVKVIRSGDIIPKIVEVVKPVKLTIPMEKGTWEWDENKVNVILTDSSLNPTVRAKQFTRFFQKLGLDDVAMDVATKLVAAGYEHTHQLCHLGKNDFAQLPGIKGSAQKLAEQMKRVHNGDFDIVTLMVASGVFERGLGNTRIQTLLDKSPELVTLEGLKALGVAGTREAAESLIGPVAAEKYARGIKAFWRWMRDSEAKVAVQKKVKAVHGPLSGQSFSWTTYRSEEEENWIRSQGGAVVPFKLTATDVLFFRTDGKKSTKVDKAKAAGILTLDFNQFKAKVK